MTMANTAATAQRLPQMGLPSEMPQVREQAGVVQSGGRIVQSGRVGEEGLHLVEGFPDLA